MVGKVGGRLVNRASAPMDAFHWRKSFSRRFDSSGKALVSIAGVSPMNKLAPGGIMLRKRRLLGSTPLASIHLGESALLGDACRGSTAVPKVGRLPRCA